MFELNNPMQDQLQQFQRLSALLNSSLKQTDIRKRATEAVVTLLDAEVGSLILLYHPTEELYFDVALGEAGNRIQDFRLQLGEGIAGHVAQTGEPALVHDVQHDPRFSRYADARSGFVTRNMICVPVRARDKILGVLEAINKKSHGRFSNDDLQNCVALGHQVGIAIDNAHLYEEISNIFEGFISACMQAIESRDPTTSGHSYRVAKLTCGLAETVGQIHRGPYADLVFDENQMKEIRYAAILHDFGKIGVHEHILLKSQKMHPGDLANLVARFDFIKRTLEVDMLQKKVELLSTRNSTQLTEDLSALDSGLKERIKLIDDIVTFIRKCNQAGPLAPQDMVRLTEIMTMNYRSFEGSLPFLTEEETKTFGIPYGTLTANERHEIENHVVHTHQFLSKIPWSATLKNVPAFALSHHEYLDGSGYPYHLSGNDIPVQTRMMTIADIYDALTASDRPYKSVLPSSQALEILEQKVEKGQLDPELFNIFVDRKVYKLI